jgi:hypothetical protein
VTDLTTLDRLDRAALDLAAAADALASDANTYGDDGSYLAVRAALLARQAEGYTTIASHAYIQQMRAWFIECAGTAPAEEGIAMAAKTTTDPLAALSARQAAIRTQHAATLAEITALRERRATFRASVAVLEPAGSEAQGIDAAEAEIAAAERRLGRFDAALREVAAELAEETARAAAERRAQFARQRGARLAQREQAFGAVEAALQQLDAALAAALEHGVAVAALDAELGDAPHAPLFLGQQLSEAAATAIALTGAVKRVCQRRLGPAFNLGVSEPLADGAPIVVSSERKE